MKTTQRHILSVSSQNKPGVLSRIAGLLRRKLFQIDSLTVGRTENPEISKFTIVIEGGVDDADKVAGLLKKLIEILSVKVLTSNCITREIVLARFCVHNDAEEKTLHKLEEGILTNEIERNGNEIVLELVDTSQRLEVFLKKIQNSKIQVVDWIRSGVIAMDA